MKGSGEKLSYFLGEAVLNDEQVKDTFDNLELITTKRIAEKLKDLDYD